MLAEKSFLYKIIRYSDLLDVYSKLIYYSYTVTE